MAVNAGSASATGCPPGSTTEASGSIRILAPGRTDTARSGATGGRAAAAGATTSTVISPVTVAPPGSAARYLMRSMPGVPNAV